MGSKSQTSIHSPNRCPLLAGLHGHLGENNASQGVRLIFSTDLVGHTVGHRKARLSCRVGRLWECILYLLEEGGRGGGGGKGAYISGAPQLLLQHAGVPQPRCGSRQGGQIQLQPHLQ